MMLLLSSLTATLTIGSRKRRAAPVAMPELCEPMEHFGVGRGTRRASRLPEDRLAWGTSLR